jgi:hypothetical protein
MRNCQKRVPIKRGKARGSHSRHEGKVATHPPLIKAKLNATGIALKAIRHGEIAIHLTNAKREPAYEKPHHFCFLGLALATQGQAEEHYIYRDPHGKLVISNKPPPPGSDVLRKLELPQATDPQVQQPHEGGDTQLNGKADGSAQPSKNNKSEVHGFKRRMYLPLEQQPFICWCIGCEPCLRPLARGVRRLIEFIPPTTQSCEICSLRRSIQSQADSGLPTQLIPVACRRVNHTFLSCRSYDK